MTAILQPGASAVLSGLDANGLVTTQFPATPVWSVADATLFSITVAADGLSAQVVPTGTAGTTVLTVTSGDPAAGGLTATATLEFDAVVTPPAPPPAPPTPGVATSMTIALTQL